MPKIFLNNGRSFSCDENDTIISAAQKSGIFLGHSCLSGRCSSCKFKLNSGKTIAIQPEVALTDDEKNSNMILACIRKPLTDVYLDAEDLSEYGLEMSKTVPAKISKIEKLTDTIIKVNLRLPPSQKINFIEGQYVDLIKDSIKRSYSIASSSELGELEFIIKNYPNGIMSQYWFNHAMENELLRLDGPKGTFFLRNHADKENLVLLANGTGIAPFKSILESKFFEIRTKHFKNIYLLWGMQNERQIFWKPSNNNVQFLPVLSRDGAKCKYIQEALIDLDIPIDKSVYYACGSDSMIQEVKKNLLQCGLDEKFFFYDSFFATS